MDTQPAGRLDRARINLEQATDTLNAARAEYHAAIAAQLNCGTRQAELVTLTGYTREQIRRIARAHGIPPAR